MEMGEKFRSNSFYIVQSAEICWKCRAGTWVFAFLLPEGHERFEYVCDEDESEEWVEIGYHCFLNYVSFLSDPMLKLIQNLSSNYYYDFSGSTGDSYYMNHCGQCGAKQGDFFMFSEPGGSFCPLSTSEAEGMKLYRFASPFEAKAGGYSSVEFLDYMQEMDVEMPMEYAVNLEINAEEPIIQNKPISAENEGGLQSVIFTLKMIAVKIKRFFYNAHIFFVKNNWRVSKNGNLYNPIVGSTVYPNRLGWNIVRYGVHYPDFPSQKEAMDAAFEMWLEERSLKSSV